MAFLKLLPPPVFRAVIGLFVATAGVVGLKMGLTTEQTTGLLGLLALATGEVAFRQPPPEES